MALLRQSRCKDRHTFSPYWQNCLPFMKLCMLPYKMGRGLHGLYVILSSYNPRNPRPQKMKGNLWVHHLTGFSIFYVDIDTLDGLGYPFTTYGI